MWLLRCNVTNNMCCCFYIPISPQLSLRLKRVWDLEWRLVSGLAPGTKLIRCDAVWRSALTVTFPQTWWKWLSFIIKGIWSKYHLCAVIVHTDITAKGLSKIDVSKGLGKDLVIRMPWKLSINHLNIFSMQVSYQQLSREKSGLLDGSVDILIESNIQETSVTFSFTGLLATLYLC